MSKIESDFEKIQNKLHINLATDLNVGNKAGTHMRGSRWARGKLIFHKPKAITGHQMHPIPLVFAQKNSKF